MRNLENPRTRPRSDRGKSVAGPFISDKVGALQAQIFCCFFTDFILGVFPVDQHVDVDNFLGEDALTGIGIGIGIGIGTLKKGLQRMSVNLALWT